MPYWTGAINDKWSEPLNWDTSAVPISSDYTAVYNVDNATIDVDIDVNVRYLTLDNKVLSFNMNDKTIICNYSFTDSTSSSSVIDSGTSTIVIGNSAADPDYAYIQTERAIFNKIITFGNVNIYAGNSSSMFDSTSKLKIKDSLIINGIGNVASTSLTYTYIDVPIIDLTNASIFKHSSSSYFVMLKYDTQIIQPEDGRLSGKFCYCINASANDQIIQVPETNGQYSNGALVLSPYDYDTGDYYSNVTFVAPISGHYGFGSGEFAYEDYDYTSNTPIGGLYTTSAILDFSANDSQITTDVLNATYSTIKLPSSVIKINRTLNFSNNVVEFDDELSEILCDVEFRNMMGSVDKNTVLQINSDVKLPKINFRRCSLSGSFKTIALSGSFTPTYKAHYADYPTLSVSVTADENVTLNNFYGNFAGSVSATSFVLSGSKYAKTSVSSITATCSSACLFYDTYFSGGSNTINGVSASAIDCSYHPYYGTPTNMVNDDIPYVYTTWTNGAADNLWSTSGNWTNGVPTSSTIAVFDYGVTTDNCIVDISTTVFGVSAKAYGTTTAAYNYSGSIEFLSSVELTIRRIAQFYRIYNIILPIDNSAVITIKDAINTTKRAFVGFSPTSTSLGSTNVFPHVNIWNDSYLLNGGRAYLKGLNLYGKLVGNYETENLKIGTSETITLGELNIFNTGYLGVKTRLMNTNLSVASTNTRPIGTQLIFHTNNISSYEIPNYYYPTGVELYTSSTNSSDVTFTFADGLIPDISFITMQGTGEITIDLSSHTQFGRICDSSTVSKKPTLILPNNKFYCSSTPNSTVTSVWSINSLASLTNDYLKPEIAKKIVTLPYNANSANLIVENQDIQFLGRTTFKNFSAINCRIYTPFAASYSPGTGTSTPGILSIGNLLISGCETSGANKIVSAYNSTSYGVSPFLEASGIVLSANKVTLNGVDLISHGYNALVYSTITPSAINMDIKGITSMTVEGNARLATDLGKNINWEFVTGEIFDVIPDEGTKWYRTVLLSGTSLDSSNIYFNDQLITSFVELTPTSAIIEVPILSAGTYQFYLG